MGKTLIPYVHYTFNPWWGCNWAGPDCDKCFARMVDKRFGGKHWGPIEKVGRKFFDAKHWQKPYDWNAAAARKGERRRVLCGSMCDVLESPDSILEEHRFRLWKMAEETLHLDWLFLTKRPENHELVPLAWQTGSRRPKNVWLGCTAGNQEMLDRRVPHVMAARWPRVRFVSVEPMLGPVDVRAFLNAGDRLDWIICGCEKVNGRPGRTMRTAWVRALWRQAVAYGVPFFLKQMEQGGKVVEMPTFDNNVWDEVPRPPAPI